MRPLTLTILGRPVDLPATTKGLVRLTQARAALADLGSRVGEYSWPLALPATRTNARIFGVGALHPLGLDKFRAVDFPFELRCAGEVFAGVFRLTSMRNGYTGNLIGAGYSWATEIGDKKLPALQLPPVAYDGTQLEAVLRKDCDATDIQFPLLSFGNFYHPPRPALQPDGSSPDQSLPAQALLVHPLSVDDYAPSVYYRNVLRQIFADIGWTLTGRVLDEAAWRETLVVPAGASPAQAWPWGALLPAAASGTGSSQFSYYGTGPGGGYANSAAGFDERAPCGNIDGLDLGGEVFFLPVPAPTIVSGGTRALDGPSATYTAPLEGVYSFTYAAQLVNGHQTLTTGPRFPTPRQIARFADLKLALLVRRGGASFDGGPLDGRPVDPMAVPHFAPLAGAFGNAGNVIPQTLTGAATDVFLQAGDTVQLCVIGRRRLVDLPTDTVLMTRREFVINFGATAFACTRYADNDGHSETLLRPALFLPPLAQRDVVRDFLLRTDSVAVADLNRRTVALLTREELRAAAGEPLDLTAVIDPDLVEYSPAAGAGVGAVAFGSAENVDEPLPAGLADAVRVAVGPGAGEQRIDSLFAPVAVRAYVVPQANGARATVEVPTMSTADALAQPLAEIEWDLPSQAPRLLRYRGVTDALTVPFQARRVPLARAEWTGVLRFDTPAGAVATYYAQTVARLTRGHVAKVPANISPAQYRQLTPGRAVLVQGATYSVETVAQFDLSDDGSQTTLELIREL